MTTYNKPNSQKHNENKKTEYNKIITGNASRRKKNYFNKAVSLFIAEDMSSIRNHILEDTVVPFIQKSIVDTIRFVFGMGKSTGGTASYNSNRVSYRDYYGSQDKKPVKRAVYEYDDIVIDSRGEAEDVLLTLLDIVNEYGLVRVGDFYDLVGVSGTPIDNDYGWTDLRTAHVIRLKSGEGYLIKLPKAVPINQR